MNKVFIIAEAGVNHNGDINIAKKLVDVAVEAGADAVKFQTFKAEKLVRKDTDKAEYQKNKTEKKETQYEMLKKLELTDSMHVELMKYCDEKEIQFLSTPFDIESLDYLLKLGMNIIKIPSGEITNYPLLKKISNSGKKVILSTGMSTLEEVRTVVKMFQKHIDDLIVLHCNTEYPTPFQDVNLKAMKTIKDELKVPVGYSDHTNGIEVAVAAVAMGAEVIEKHFTLDKTMNGPDHNASLEPEELKKMIQSIRNIELAMGNGIKEPTNSEIKNINVIRKSIVAKCYIKKGEYFTEKNLATKRPGNGLSPMKWQQIVGTRALKDYQEDELIKQ